MRADHPLAQSGGKVAISQIAREPFLLYAPSLAAGFNDHLFSLFRNSGIEPEIAQEASSPTTLLGLVAAGFGVTVIARSLSALHLDNVAYREIDCANAVSRLWLVRHHAMSPACALLVSLIEANVAAARAPISAA
jgi:DNA-binding transcriptional LysR family regulator